MAVFYTTFSCFVVPARAWGLAGITSGTTVPQLNRGDLSPLVVAIPPLDLQFALQQKQHDIFSIQAQQNAATQKAELTFDALLGHAFSGL
jgi:type I restriction enzyme S subunit